MTINPMHDSSFDLESNTSSGSSITSECDHSSDDCPLTTEEVQCIYDDLDLNEEGITAHEVTRRKRRIFVGGLKFASEACVLHEYFGQFGKIEEAAVIKDRKTGLSKGYGFVTMYADTSALKAVMDKSPKLDGRRCNVNLAYIGQKKKPPSKKPDLKLKSLSPLQGQVFNYNTNGYLVSPTVLTPSGQYYQFGLPPLHGHQPVYQIPQSPSQCCYEPAETYVGHSPIPPSPMSPMYQQPVYYNYTQPFVIGNCPPGGTVGYAAPPQNTIYQTTTVVTSQNDLNSTDTNHNNNNNKSNNSNIKNFALVDMNNNNNNLMPQNNAATTNVVPSTYGLASTHQPTPYSPTTIPVSSSSLNLNGNAAYTGVATETRPLVVNGKPNMSNDLAITPVHAGHPQVVNNGGPMSAVSNITLLTNGSSVVSHPTANVHLINGGAILHPQIVGMPTHNVPVSTFVTQPVPSPPMQSQNQGHMYHHIQNQNLPQATYMQQREVVI